MADNTPNYRQVRESKVILTIIIAALMIVFLVTGLTRAIFAEAFHLSGTTLDEAVRIFAVFILYPLGAFYGRDL